MSVSTSTHQAVVIGGEPDRAASNNPVAQHT